MITILRPGGSSSGGGSGASLPNASAGQVLVSNGSTWSAKSGDYSISCVIDGGTDPPATGDKAEILVSSDCVITGVSLYANQAGSALIDVQRATYASYPTFTSLCAAAKPVLVTASKSTDVTLTGWTKTLATGDILRFRVESVDTLTRVVIALTVRRV